jgi:CheY-like chemotaxis protein/DNA-binding PadR family transcriptional regulator
MSRILVVDDEAIITMQLEERLTAMGYTVAGMAASGEGAIDMARRLKPDLLLMDIVMPGRLNGIEAARVIMEELDIPVVFVTSYADDAIIEQAKQVRPYGYIVKPFNELEIKAAIEVALFHKNADREKAGLSPVAGEAGRAGKEIAREEDAGTTYVDLPGIKTVLLQDIFTDIVLFLYTEQTVKDPVFKFTLEEGLKKGGRNFFAYHRSTLMKYFLKEIQKEELVTRRIKKHEEFLLLKLLEKCTGSLEGTGPAKSLRILLDFSDTEMFTDILAVKNLVLSKKESGLPVSGMIALNMAEIDHNQIQKLSEGIPKIIISTGKDTMLSFAQRSFPAESLSVVPQSTIDDVVKKSLEPVVLSLLEKPISGYDIVHEIHNRYNVLIPQARIYTFLYELQEKGYLEMKSSGKSKLYMPTEAGRKYIRQKLGEFRFVFRHLMGEGMDDNSIAPPEKR